MALPAVDKLGNVFRGADLETSLSMLAVNMAAKVDTLPHKLRSDMHVTYPCIRASLAGRLPLQTP